MRCGSDFGGRFAIQNEKLHVHAISQVDWEIQMRNYHIWEFCRQNGKSKCEIICTYNFTIGQKKNPVSLTGEILLAEIVFDTVQNTLCGFLDAFLRIE